jgi:hypothetical protein
VNWAGVVESLEIAKVGGGGGGAGILWGTVASGAGAEDVEDGAGELARGSEGENTATGSSDRDKAEEEVEGGRERDWKRGEVGSMARMSSSVRMAGEGSGKRRRRSCCGEEARGRGSSIVDGVDKEEEAA